MRDQTIPFDAELFINFHVPGVLIGYALLGWLLNLFQRLFLRSTKPVASYIWVLFGLWTVFPGSLPVTSQIYLYSFWPIYVYLAAQMLWARVGPAGRRGTDVASQVPPGSVAIPFWRRSAVPINICLVGGISGASASLRSKHAITPGTVLLDGFQKAGVTVRPVSHADFQPSNEHDIVHVHHFGKAAMKMASAGSRARFVFTGHNG